MGFQPQLQVISCNTSNSPLICSQGSATNQDGRSSSLTAPNGPAQQDLILSAFHACSDVSGISLLAVHGTGTPLGDPIETGAIGAAMLKLQGNEQHQASPLVLASTKARYGHTEGAAGGLSLALQLAK